MTIIFTTALFLLGIVIGSFLAEERLRGGESE